MEYRFNGITEKTLARLENLVSESEIEVSREVHVIKVGDVCFKNEIISCVITSCVPTRLVVITWADEIIVYKDFRETVHIKANEIASFTAM